MLALIEDRDEFVQLNSNGMSLLDQRKVRAALGLPQRVGQPRKGYQVREVYTVRLEPADAEYASKLVESGNLADGLTQLIREHRERTERRTSSR